MSALTRLALETLVDPGAPPGLKTVACNALLVAFREGLAVAAGSHMAVWRYLAGLESGAELVHRFEITHPDVAADAVRMLLDPDSGEAAKSVALAVLRGPNLSAIGERELFTIVDRVLVEERVREVVWLIQRLHEDGLGSEVIVAVRDRLAESRIPSIRVAAVEIGALLARVDEAFVTRMLADKAAPVRTEVADQLAGAHDLDRDRALTILREHLAVESHGAVLKALHFATAALVRQPTSRGG